MSQKVRVELVDDIDGSASGDVQAVQFGLDGVTYEIDLSEANAAALRAALEVYVVSGRRLSGRAKPGTGRRSAGHRRAPAESRGAAREPIAASVAGEEAEAEGALALVEEEQDSDAPTPVVASPLVRHSREQLAAIRDWAKRNGYEVAERGRVSVSVIKAFNAAHARPRPVGKAGRRAPSPGFTGQ